MAGKKSLANQARMRTNMISGIAQQSKGLQKRISEETEVKDLPVETQNDIIYLTDEELLDDPINTEYYDGYEVEELAETMKRYGFKGIILAYPYEGKYMIESGHRRREAARKAGIDKYPVLKTEAPKYDWERKMRLFLGNLHGRKERPMTIAKVAQGLFETHESELKYKKENGLLKEGEITSLNELVALDMEMDLKTVQVYRRLNNLIPELQKLADDERYAWSAIAEASNMSEEKQKQLYSLITERTETVGAELVDRKWIQKTIKSLKEDKVEEKKSNARVRRRDGTKIIKKCAEELHEVLDKDSLIKEKERENVIKTLSELRESIDKKIAELQNQ